MVLKWNTLANNRFRSALKHTNLIIHNFRLINGHTQLMKYIEKIIVPMVMAMLLYSCHRGNGATPSSENVANSSKKIIAKSVPQWITRTICKDRNGSIWIAAFDGVFKYDGATFEHVTKDRSDARFFSVLEDNKGNFWFASVGSGVFYYDGKSFEQYTVEDGLVNDRVTNIFEDEQGIIWFGTEGGISLYDGTSFKNFTIENGLTNSDVNVVQQDNDGNFWIGTRGEAYRYDGNKFNVITQNGKSFTNVRTIVKDKRGIIWLGGNDGLWRYESGDFTNITKDFVGYLYEDSGGNVWASAQDESSNAGFGHWHLSRYDAKTLYDDTPKVTEIPSPFAGNKGMLFGILEDDDGKIWFGTLRGTYRYDGIMTTKVSE